MSRKFFDFIHRLYPRSFRSKLAYLLGISRLSIQLIADNSPCLRESVSRCTWQFRRCFTISTIATMPPPNPDTCCQPRTKPVSHYNKSLPNDPMHNTQPLF